jgi:hypothetical protein
LTSSPSQVMPASRRTHAPPGISHQYSHRIPVTPRFGSLQVPGLRRATTHDPNTQKPKASTRPLIYLEVRYRAPFGPGPTDNGASRHHTDFQKARPTTCETRTWTVIEKQPRLREKERVDL